MCWIAYVEFYDFEAICKVLIVTIYFSDHYQSNPIILGGGGGEERNPNEHTHTHTQIPFTLILIEPNSSCFEFHNSRRVKLENVSLNNGASVFPPKGSDCVEHFNWLSDLRLPV